MSARMESMWLSSPESPWGPVWVLLRPVSKFMAWLIGNIHIVNIFWLANLLTDLNLQYYHTLLHTVCCNKRFYLPCDQIPWRAHCSDNTVMWFISESTCLPKWYTCSKFYAGPGGFTKPTQQLSATDSNWSAYLLEIQPSRKKRK